MDRVNRNIPVVQAPELFPIPGGNPALTNPHPALVVLSKYFLLVQHHVATSFERWLPEIQIVADPNPIVPRRERGVRQALVVAAPPLVMPALAIPAREVDKFPTRCQRRLVLLISAGCSSVVIIWLSNRIGPANLPFPVAPVDLPLDMPLDLPVVL